METGVPKHVSVENVQVLASKNPDVVPSRYIRPELMDDVVSVDEGSTIPIIDLSKLMDEQFCQDELKKFHLACQDWGFFQLINHGIEEDVLEKFKTDVTEFFKLPIEVKKGFSQEAFSQEPGLIQGYGQSHVFSDEQKLDWGDMLYLYAQPEVVRSTKLWPTYPLTFRDIVIKYSSELERIKKCVLGLMAKNLGVDKEKFTNVFDNGLQSIRFNYYPPCPEADKVLGISPHSDATGITFLVQVNHVDGLQIRHEGRWVPVVLSTNAILVNIGDVLEILSNGKYKSIEHRVLVNKKKERLSVAAFHEVNENMTIGPFPDLIKEGEHECYRTVSYDEYYKLLMGRELNGKSLIEDLKLEK